MNIRPADLESDWPDMMRGARDFVSRLAHPEVIPTDDERLSEALRTLLGLPGVEVTVAEHEGRVVGGIGMIYAPFHWNPEILWAEELFWWTDRNAPPTAAMRLFREACRVGRERGAWANFKRLMESPEGVDSVYRRSGFEPIEVSYMGRF